MKYPLNKLAILLPVLMYGIGANAEPGYAEGGSLPTAFDTIINAEDYGVIADDGQDDSAALQDIIDNYVTSSTTEFTAIQLPAGEIDISDEIHVDKSGLVIKGAGSDPETGTNIVVTSWKPYGVDSSNAPDFDKKYWPGFGAFRVETREKAPDETDYEGSVNFHWEYSINFEETASIGDTSIKVVSGKSSYFDVGTLIYVGAANDDAFLDKGEVPEDRRDAEHIKNGHMRTQIFKVIGVDRATDTITLDRPLEFDIPLENESGYHSRAMPVTAIENFGFQDFYITMTPEGSDCEGYNPDLYTEDNPNGVLHRYENVCAADAIHGVILKWAYNGWVNNINVEMMGSHPIVTEFAKDITISNNTVNGSWNKGAGGNGYVRGSKLYDSWIHDNDIQNVRHLTLQWSATGNIVENNTLNEDLNLHGGWERNNLIRNNTVEVPYEHRNWADGAPEPGATWQPIWVGSGDHASKWSGPTGPNNVFVDNSFKKAETEGAAITEWGLFDEPGTEYAFNWTGSDYLHFNVDGEPAPTWDQEIAEGVYAQIPSSGVSTEGGSWNRPTTDPVEPPTLPEACNSTVVDYVWGEELEIVISRDSCIRVDRNLSDKNVQVWDSDANPSCDFRGTVDSLDGTGSITVDEDYEDVEGALSGTIIQFSSSNSCDFVKFRAY